VQLSDFIAQEKGNATQLAVRIGISPSYLSQMATGYRSISPARSLLIERATNGLVTRRDLRPNDWWAIWPELAVHADKEPVNSPPLPSLPAPTFSPSGRGGVSQRAMVEAAA